jgi:hypothetical protein
MTSDMMLQRLFDVAYTSLEYTEVSDCWQRHMSYPLRCLLLNPWSVFHAHISVINVRINLLIGSVDAQFPPVVSSALSQSFAKYVCHENSLSNYVAEKNTRSRTEIRHVTCADNARYRSVTKNDYEINRI